MSRTLGYKVVNIVIIWKYEAHVCGNISADKNDNISFQPTITFYVFGST